METPKHYYCFLWGLLVGLALLNLANAQNPDQSGFISLDCGSPENTSYAEKQTQINYVSDAPFISTGVSRRIMPQYRADFQQHITYLRAFPDGIRNCYNISIVNGTKYLIRSSFVYGNYDNLNVLPSFDVHVGANLLRTVQFNSSSVGQNFEIIYTPPRNYIHICLVNTGLGTPFIQAIELRPLPNDTYLMDDSNALLTFGRFDLGSTSNLAYRYPSDAYDRYWSPYYDERWTSLSTPSEVRPRISNTYWPPNAIMQNAAVPKNENSSLEFYLTPPNPDDKYFVYLHFAEIQVLKADEYRGFNINLNDQPFYGPMTPVYLTSDTIYTLSRGMSKASNYSFSIDRLINSTLPPILNAIEFYTEIYFSQSETDLNDVDAINKIKLTYGVKRNWNGDPCVPVKYLWTGLNCSSNVFDSPRITSLDLSSSQLSGEITEYISRLTMLQSLDLSNNSLNGTVPEFLAFLPDLRVLNLKLNNFNGSIPAKLLERSKSGSLTLSYGDNGSSCGSSCTKKKSSNILVPILGAIGGLVAVVIIVLVVLFLISRNRRNRQGSVGVNNVDSRVDDNSLMETRNRQYKYSDVIKMTNNFERVLGKGGFGTVYYGFIQDTNTPVAVKILSASSVQGFQEFQTEVKLLVRVHHRNLTSLVGYCNEGTNKALIYEFMANGNLETHISGNNQSILSWEGRLQIAIDSAQGLEYLHNGCKPPIVHRDVKTTNILLTENFQAKIADFGLSKIFPTDGGTYVSTIIAGTPGYLDPEYYSTNRLNEKSDVYSFGVVMLQIITGKTAIISSGLERTHLGSWVSSMINNGDIHSVVDPKLNGDFDVNSVWKAVEISMSSVSHSANKRPNMNHIVIELKECLALEQARRNYNISPVTDSANSIETFSMIMPTETNPLAR